MLREAAMGSLRVAASFLRDSRPCDGLAKARLSLSRARLTIAMCQVAKSSVKPNIASDLQKCAGQDSNLRPAA
jgi:hypothetical protein